MSLIVHNLIAELEPFFLSAASPKDKFAQAQRTILDPAAGMTSRMARALESPEYAVMSAALQDGYDVVAAQQVWGLFNPTRSRTATEWQFARYREANLPMVAQRAWDRLPHTQDVECYLLPGDAANRTFMMHNLGVSAFAGSGQIRVAIWPSEHNLAIFPEVIARMHAHIACAGSATLGRFIEREAMAAGFESATWIERSQRDLAAWREALRELASLCGVASAADLPVNVYGSRSTLSCPISGINWRRWRMTSEITLAS